MFPPAGIEVPSARSTLLFVPIMLPVTPKGGFETVIERGTPLVVALLVKRSFKDRVVFSVTFPKVKFDPEVYCTHPLPSVVWNSNTAIGASPEVATTSKVLLPPSELTVRYAPKLPLLAGSKLMMTEIAELPGIVDGRSMKVKGPTSGVDAVPFGGMNGPVSLIDEYCILVIVNGEFP